MPGIIAVGLLCSRSALVASKVQEVHVVEVVAVARAAKHQQRDAVPPLVVQHDRRVAIPACNCIRNAWMKMEA